MVLQKVTMVSFGEYTRNETLHKSVDNNTSKNINTELDKTEIES